MEAKMRQPLTRVQRQVLRKLLKFFKEKQRWPSMREMSKLRGRAGYTNNEWQHLNRMIAKGWIEKDGRHFQVVGFTPFLVDAVYYFFNRVQAEMDQPYARTRSRPAAE